MTDKLIRIPGLPRTWLFTQQEIDLIKAYEPLTIWLGREQDGLEILANGSVKLTGTAIEVIKSYINNKEN